MSNIAQARTELLPPQEIVEAAQAVVLWAAKNGLKNWQLGGVCDRRFAAAHDRKVIDARTEFDSLWRNWPLQERLRCFNATLSPEQTEDVRLLCWAVFLHGKDLKENL